MHSGQTVESDVRSHAPRLDIQGLRGLAVLIVVLFHAGLPLTGGFIGVDVFFVISGYVITAMLLRELTGLGRLRFRRFYERRIRRLVPALVLVLLVTVGFSFLFGSPFDNQQQITAQTAIGAITMTANAVIFLNSGDYFATPPTNNPLLNTWSLSVEEQFYLVFPALLVGLWWLARRYKAATSQSVVLISGLAIVGILSFGLSVILSFEWVSSRLSDPNWFAFYSSPTRAWEFAAGGVTYLLIREPLGRRVSQFLFVAGIAGIVASSFYITESMVFPGWIALLPVISTVLILAGGVAQPWSSTVLTNRPMVILGDSSYSWYLWHWPFIAFGVMLFPETSNIKIYAAALSLIVALATTKYLENPIRFSTRLGETRSWIIFFGSVLVVAAASAALLLGSRNAWWNDNIQSMQLQISQKHLWLTEGCGSAVPLGERGPECTWNSEASGPTIYLLGDSLAGALSEAVLGAATELGRPVKVGTQGACPFIGNAVDFGDLADSDCTDFVLESTRWLQEQAPGDVVLSSSLGYLILGSVSLSFPPSDSFENTYDGKLTNYLAGLKQTVQELSASGHRVHVLLPPPGFPLTVMDGDAWFPSQCNTLDALRDISSCGEGRSLSDVIAETSDLYSQVTSAVESADGVVVNPQSWVCDNGTCSTNIGNEWRYLDGSHLSVGFSERLAPNFIELLQN